MRPLRRHPRRRPPAARGPTSLPEQIKAIAQLLSAQGTPQSVEGIAVHFSARDRWRERLPTTRQTLEALGRVKQVEPSRLGDAESR